MSTEGYFCWEFGVGENAIRKIRSGQTWGWVKAEGARR